MSMPYESQEPQAYEAQPVPDSPIEATQPFRAEVRKRKHTRQVVGGLILALGLIGILALAAVMVKQYRAEFAQNQAAKEKDASREVTVTRKSRDFNAQDPAEAPVAETPAAPVGNTALPSRFNSQQGGPLPNSMTLPNNPAPLPSSYPSQQGLPSGTVPVDAPRRVEAAPSMMMGGPADAEDAAAKAEAMIAKSSALTVERTVQAMSKTKSNGKPVSASDQASAAQLGDRSFLLARGSWIPCVLETQLNSSVPGNTSCVVPEDVYSDDGKALLVEKGSRVQGSYGNSLKVGDQRIAVQWARIKTTRGIVVDVDSPATDGVGTAGAGGYVDNHWMDRIGAAVLLSLVDDALAYTVADAQNKQSSNAQGSQGTNVFLPNSSIGSTRRLSEKILDSTINIAPTLYKNRGDRVMIFVNRDLWFDSTYRLVKTP
ncbi:type IV secretion system protein VirB10 [Variovorax ginsengisoli]|uniref:Type IV secretion system protein VirB10 n=1 Tax=Variovorax ginsengisoli TaxID=363844 RepID=A0ABT9SDF3_9BURK|nr:type IV secretion system protein VirB10 [Variovorax ginsengisoli]MDP9902391.1 type IV secretion system protein VirB10 [Variovorax ginsengisoli]